MTATELGGSMMGSAVETPDMCAGVQAQCEKILFSFAVRKEAAQLRRGSKRRGREGVHQIIITVFML